MEAKQIDAWLVLNELLAELNWDKAALKRCCTVLIGTARPEIVTMVSYSGWPEQPPDDTPLAISLDMRMVEVDLREPNSVAELRKALSELKEKSDIGKGPVDWP